MKVSRNYASLEDMLLEKGYELRWRIVPKPPTCYFAGQTAFELSAWKDGEREALGYSKTKYEAAQAVFKIVSQANGFDSEPEFEDPLRTVTEDHNGDIEIKHPSQALMSVNRVHSGGSRSFFGASIQASTWVCIRIHAAALRRNVSLSYDRYTDENLMIELVMTPNQWAEFVSSFGTQGTPMTVSYHPVYGGVGYQHWVSARQALESDFATKSKSALDRAKELTDRFLKMAKEPGALSVKEKQALAQEMFEALRFMSDNMPYMVTQFSESMDRVVTEARAEFEGYVAGRMDSMGEMAIQLGLTHADMTAGLVAQNDPPGGDGG